MGRPLTQQGSLHRLVLGVGWPTKFFYGKCNVVLSRCAGLHVTNIFMHESDTDMEIVESNGTPANNLRLIESSQSQRRSCNYLGVLARAPQSLTAILSSHPYDMPRALLEKLK